MSAAPTGWGGAHWHGDRRWRRVRQRLTGLTSSTRRSWSPHGAGARMRTCGLGSGCRPSQLELAPVRGPRCGPRVARRPAPPTPPPVCSSSREPTPSSASRTARYDDAEESISLGEMTVLLVEGGHLHPRAGEPAREPLCGLRLERDPDRLQEGPMGISAADRRPGHPRRRPCTRRLRGPRHRDRTRGLLRHTRHQPIRTRPHQLKREVRQLLVAIEFARGAVRPDRSVPRVPARSGRGAARPWRRRPTSWAAPWAGRSRCRACSTRR